MLGLIIILIFAILLIVVTLVLLRKHLKRQSKAVESLREQVKLCKSSFVNTVEQISKQDETVHQILTLYEINRKLAYILDVEKLIKTFIKELMRIPGIRNVEVSQTRACGNIFNYDISEYKKDHFLHVDCADAQLSLQVPYLVSQLRILIDRALIYRRMQKMSITDYLTNVSNRRHFMERFRQEFNRAKRFNFPLSFIIVDIDHFKKINDTYGHLVGDEILRNVARVLAEKIREIDFIGRYGGEEFVIFLPEAPHDAAIRAAKRLKVAIEKESFKAYDETLNVTISAGVSTYPDFCADKDELIEKADNALYLAKESGRNIVCSCSNTENDEV